MSDDRVVNAVEPARWKRATLGFVAGGVGALIFHQGMLALLHVAGVTPAVPYDTRPTTPFGVPQFLSAAFWGGVWGIILALFVWRGRSIRRDWIVAAAFGAVAPTLVAWLVVAPLKHRPLAGGGAPSAMLTGLLVNGAWGLGTAMALTLFMRTRRPLQAGDAG
jgi:hypothetical protein